MDPLHFSTHHLARNDTFSHVPGVRSSRGRAGGGLRRWADMMKISLQSKKQFSASSSTRGTASRSCLDRPARPALVHVLPAKKTERKNLHYELGVALTGTNLNCVAHRATQVAF